MSIYMKEDKYWGFAHVKNIQELPQYKSKKKTFQDVIERASTEITKKIFRM